jgi:hypothetical protein
MAMHTSHGGCLCGYVRFRVEWPSQWVAHCHCTLCRRAHGAGYVTWFGMAEDRARIHDDAGSLRWYASSPGAERGFCARCGSSLFFRSERWPGELHITLANLDGPADRVPQAHVFWDTHVDWAAGDPQDGLPRRPAASSD